MPTIHGNGSVSSDLMMEMLHSVWV